MKKKTLYIRPDIQVVAMDTANIMAGSGGDRETLPMGGSKEPEPGEDGYLYGE